MNEKEPEKNLEEKVENLQKSNNIMKGLLVVLAVAVLVSICFGIGFLLGGKTSNAESGKETEIGTEKETETDKKMPENDELITRSKTLYSNIYKLLYKNIKFVGDDNNGEGYTVDGIDSVGKITSGEKLVLDLINETFIDFDTAIKYVPYYEKDGVYYYTLGDLGGDGGYYIYNYIVKEKAPANATILIERVSCYDIEQGKATAKVDDASKCNDKSDVLSEKLYLKKANGKWLVEKFDSEVAFSLK